MKQTFLDSLIAPWNQAALLTSLTEGWGKLENKYIVILPATRWTYAWLQGGSDPFWVLHKNMPVLFPSLSSPVHPQKQAQSIQAHGQAPEMGRRCFLPPVQGLLLQSSFIGTSILLPFLRWQTNRIMNWSPRSQWDNASEHNSPPSIYILDYSTLHSPQTLTVNA